MHNTAAFSKLSLPHISDAIGSSGGQRTSKVQETGECRVQLFIKAFELRYVQQASTVIRDLLLVNAAPKIVSRLHSSDGSSSIKLPGGDAPIPQKLPIITVLTSPHIDKTAREQFQKKVHKRCIITPPLQFDEARWFLDSVNSYEFVGVQIQVKVASRTFLMAPPTLNNMSSKLLREHQEKYADYFRQRSEKQSHKSNFSLEAMQQILKDGLLDLRRQLPDKFQKEYKEWFIKNKHRAGQPLGSGVLEADAAAFIAAFDSVLLNLDFSALNRYRLHPYQFAQAPLLTKEKVGELMYAILKYGQYRKQQLEKSQEAEILQAYKEYSRFSETVLLMLLQLWARKSTAALKEQYALPLDKEVLQWTKQKAMKR